MCRLSTTNMTRLASSIPSRHNGEMPRCVTSMLHEANQSKVVRNENFVSSSEISLILSTITSLDLCEYTVNHSDQINSEGVPTQSTSYVNSDNHFESKFPWLHHRLLTLIKEADMQHEWGLVPCNRDTSVSNLLSASINTRVVEFHHMEPGAQLSNMYHYDVGSLITVDIMLQEAELGGHFQTISSSGSECIERERFLPGDALVFQSHKYHHVTPVITGERKVLVVEYWCGEKRTCGHRCDIMHGECNFVDDYDETDA